jgi:outer membrane receptor protein involved in Fe transport
MKLKLPEWHCHAKKWTTAFVLCSLFLCWTHRGMAQQTGSKTITYQASKVKVEAVLQAIEQQTASTLTYSRDEMSAVIVKSVNWKNKPLQEALKELQQEYGIFYSLSGNNIALKLVPKAEAPKKLAVPGRVIGKIIDEETSEPVPAVSVLIGDKGATSNVDGTFAITLPKGIYEAAVSSVGYGKKIVTDITVKDNQTFELNVTLKREKGQLSGVVVTGSARRESIAALFVKQKNAAEMSDGISAEQISATPDKHVGETLKRITGVSTNDNRKVVVRGIAERYNVALLNGSTLPSTDVQERDFEFNLIPTNLVDNIVVSKTATPDMPYGFAGGLVQITTKSVPAANFTSVSAGLSVNSRTTGQNFMGYQRGKYDYFGFDDGSRDHYPDGLFPIDGYNPRQSDNQNVVKAAAVGAQNKRIGGTERLGTRSFQTMPSQNYQLSLGRVYSLSNDKVRKLGFVGSLTYRNTQTIDQLDNMRRGSWSRFPPLGTDYDNTGKDYRFNTTIGVLLNGGFKTQNHQINSYNLYTRIFDSRFRRIQGWTDENPNLALPIMQEDNRPKFSDLVQNKFNGIHQFSRFKVEWNIARTYLKSLEQDAVTALLLGDQYENTVPFFNYTVGNASNSDWGPMYRGEFFYKEENREAGINVSYLLNAGKTTHTFKAGFNYLGKHGSYGWQVLPIVANESGGGKYAAIPVAEWGNYMSMENRDQDIFYQPSAWTLNKTGFEAKSKNMGTFLMLDQRLLPNLRLVWGLRADYFKLDTLRNSASLMADRTTILVTKENKDWYYLPSVNITYSPVSNLNVRAAYSKTVIRPGLMENSRFSRFSPEYGTQLRSSGVISTLVNSYDAKLEWFPGAGEIVSAGYFYKYMDKPAEYYRKNNNSGGNPYITITNSEWAKVSGWEFEVRKNLGFIHPGSRLLKDLYISGNLTLQQSEVKARELGAKTLPDGTDSIFYTFMKYSRDLYGQVPVLYNMGVQYAGNRLGVNLVYNYMGYKTFIAASSADLAEFERPRGQLDAQISYRFLNKKMEAKLNISNLTDAPYRFYMNPHTTYVIKPNAPAITEEWADRYEWRPGFSDKFEEEAGYTEDGQRKADIKTLTRYVGRTFSFSISYNF